MSAEDSQEGLDKLQEAQALYEKYVELAAIGERVILERLARAAAERSRVEYTTHQSLATTPQAIR